MERPTITSANCSPCIIYSDDPDYPAAALEREAEGTVVLWLVVETQGKVSQAAVARKADPDLGKAAVSFIKKQRFEPALMDGKPVRVQINVEVRFIAKPRPKPPQT